MVQVLGATDWQFAISHLLGSSAKHIPDVAVFDDRGVVRSFDITGDANDLWHSRAWLLGVNSGSGEPGRKHRYKGEPNCHSCFQGQLPPGSAMTFFSGLKFWRRLILKLAVSLPGSLSSATWRLISLVISWSVT